MYNDINNKEETNASLMLTIMSDHKYINNARKKTVNSHENCQNEFPFQVRTTIPPDLHQIQPRTTQVWTVMKLVLTPTVNGTRLCVLTRSFKGV